MEEYKAYVSRMVRERSHSDMPVLTSGDAFVSKKAMISDTVGRLRIFTPNIAEDYKELFWNLSRREAEIISIEGTNSEEVLDLLRGSSKLELFSLDFSKISSVFQKPNEVPSLIVNNPYAVYLYDHPVGSINFGNPERAYKMNGYFEKLKAMSCPVLC